MVRLFRRSSRTKPLLTPEILALQCDECGGWHTMKCPRVKALDYEAGDEGHRKRVRVEYWEPGTWEKRVSWREDFDEYTPPLVGEIVDAPR